METSANTTASKQYVGSQTEEVMERNPGPGSAENNIGLDERGKLKWCLNCKKCIGLGCSKGSDYAFQEYFLSFRCKDRPLSIALECGGGQQQGVSASQQSEAHRKHPCIIIHPN